MALKSYNPTSPAQRGLILVDKSALWKGKPVKALTEGKRKTGGRNNKGHVTSRGIAGGHKQKYRFIDFKRRKWDAPAIVERMEYDPNRSAFIALIQFGEEKRYIIAPAGLKVGQKVEQGPGVAPEIGNALPLAEIPLGTLVHNIEMNPGQGAKICRSAGSYAQLMAREGKYAAIKLPSGESRLILAACLATIGSVGNQEHSQERKGKAGRSRWMGVRPRVRPSAMNPVDHPMGGGEGRASGGHPRSRTGKYAKGEKTRTRGKGSDKLIIQRRDGKKLTK